MARRLVLALLVVGALAVHTPEGRAAAAPSVPILFNSGAGLEAIDPDGTNRRTIVAKGGNADQTADGSKIVFQRTATRVDAEGYTRYTTTLHVVNSDGTGERRVGDLYGTMPRWSPDGSKVAYNVADPDTREHRGSGQIAIANADGSAATVIAAGSDPDWSPDGQTLAYAALARVWLIPAMPGARAVAITPTVHSSQGITTPQWSPDGTVIGFGGPCIGFVHPDGSGFRCEATSSGFFDFGGWSPDGRTYVWGSGRVHGWTDAAWTDPDTGVTRRAAGIHASWANPSGPQPCPSGYWMLGRDGGVFTFGAARFYGSTGAMRLAAPVVGMSATSSTAGYWLVAADGGVFSFGDATFLGSMGGTRLRAPVVGMVRTPTGRGYWLVASDGGVFTFGDAEFFGSTGAMTLRSPVVGIAPTPTGSGYWLVASDGGVFTFGDAQFLGSAGGTTLDSPVVSLAPTPTGDGYVLVTGAGGTLEYGDAAVDVDAASSSLSTPVVSGQPVRRGTLLVTAAGEAIAIGDARFCGSATHLRLAAPIIGLATI